MTSHTSISPQEAADRLAIRELVDAYAHCADRRDAKGQQALFTEDTRFLVFYDLTSGEPSQELHGRESLAPVFDDLNQYVATMHFNGQSTISLDGDRAAGESYCLAHHLSVAEDGQRTLMVASIRYLDEFVKQDGQWLFAERRLMVNWIDTRPSTALSAGRRSAGRRAQAGVHLPDRDLAGLDRGEAALPARREASGVPRGPGERSRTEQVSPRLPGGMAATGPGSRSAADPAGSGERTMIEKILPAGVECAEAFGDEAQVALFPEEQALLARAVEKRRREFTTARGCARRALAALDVPPVPILPGERGEPRWPPGIVGSITHCAGYRGAAVARARDVLTIGIDAEPDDVLPKGVLDTVSTPGERARLRDLAAAAPGTHWDRLLFSAKESVYKAWFPLARRWLGFEEADIVFDAVNGTFDARLLATQAEVGRSALVGFSGRWLACDGLLLTAIVTAGVP